MAGKTHSGVDMAPDPKPDRGDEDEVEVAVRGFVVSGDPSAALLRLRDAALDEISQGVDVTVDDWLNLAVSPGRDDAGDAACFKVRPDEVRIVAPVGQQHTRFRAGSGHDWSMARDVRTPGSDQGDGGRQAQAVASQMDLGREAAARTAKTVAFNALFFRRRAGGLARWWSRSSGRCPTC